MLKKSLHRIVVALLLIAFTMFGIVGCAKKSGSEKTSIVFGAARSQSGVYAFFDQNAFGPIYRMWADQVNANGGIYVKELDKKLPVELKIYDDTSDLGTMTRMYEKLMLEDKVDFILPPVSTAFLNAVAPIANRNGYILIGAEGGSETLKTP
jgi:branched-chain amino acid transport system substrate-binding protein